MEYGRPIDGDGELEPCHDGWISRLRPKESARRLARRDRTVARSLKAVFLLVRGKKRWPQRIIAPSSRSVMTASPTLRYLQSRCEQLLAARTHTHTLTAASQHRHAAGRPACQHARVPYGAHYADDHRRQEIQEAALPQPARDEARLPEIGGVSRGGAHVKDHWYSMSPTVTPSSRPRPPRLLARLPPAPVCPVCPVCRVLYLAFTRQSLHASQTDRTPLPSIVCV